MESTLFLSVIKKDIKTARHGDDELVQTFVCMTSSFSATWDVIKVIHTLNIEGYVLTTFNES
jgi:hypothetical protein